MQFWKKKEPFQEKSLLIPSARSAEMDEAISLWQEIFFGKAPWLSHKRPRSLSLAAVSTQYLARLVCSELKMEVDGSPRGKWLNEAVSAQVLPQLVVALQQAMATGSVAFKPYIQDGIMKVEWLRADQFYPVEEGPDGQISKIVFLSHAHWQNVTYLRMEYHRFEDGQYRISNSAFECDGNGRPKRPVSLEKIPQWADIQEEVAIEGLTAPLYALWRMPFANTVDGSAEPVSLYAAGAQVLEDIDRLYNDYCFEFATARRKMILREDSLRLKRDGSPILPHSEHAADVYLPLDLPGDSQPFADYSPQLREAAYRDGLNQLLRMYEMLCGLSNGSFSTDEKGALTATEIISQDRRTYATVCEIQQQGRVAMEALVSAMDGLASLYGIGGCGDWKLSVSFGDSVFEDTETEFKRQLKLVEIGMKPELLLAWYFDKDEKSAAEMLAKGEEKDESR